MKVIIELEKASPRIITVKVCTGEDTMQGIVNLSKKKILVQQRPVWKLDLCWGRGDYMTSRKTTSTNNGTCV